MNQQQLLYSGHCGLQAGGLERGFAPALADIGAVPPGTGPECRTNVYRAPHRRVKRKMGFLGAPGAVDRPARGGGFLIFRVAAVSAARGGSVPDPQTKAYRGRDARDTRRPARRAPFEDACDTSGAAAGTPRIGTAGRRDYPPRLAGSKPKNLSALELVNSANASSARPRTVARAAATWTTLAGSLVFIFRTGSGER